MTHYTVQFNSAILELATVSSLEQGRFQGTLENWRSSSSVGSRFHDRGGRRGNRKRLVV